MTYEEWYENLGEDLAENQQGIAIVAFNAGHNSGFNEGYKAGYIAGKNAQADTQLEAMIAIQAKLDALSQHPIFKEQAK